MYLADSIFLSGKQENATPVEFIAQFEVVVTLLAQKMTSLQRHGIRSRGQRFKITPA